jgi:putative NADH-flavin reductase
MKITVFGATGQIGELFTQKALDEGNVITAYVRNPKKLSISHKNLTVVKGNLDELEKIQHTIAGSDVVVSTLGPLMIKGIQGTPVLDGYKNIIAGMEKEKVTRFIALGTVAIKSNKDVRSILTTLPVKLANIVLPNGVGEMVSIGDAIKSSQLNWTIVRILMPIDKDNYKPIKVSFGEKRIKWKQSRENMANFFLTELNNNQFVKSMPIIGS